MACKYNHCVGAKRAGWGSMVPQCEGRKEDGVKKTEKWGDCTGQGSAA